MSLKNCHFIASSYPSLPSKTSNLPACVRYHAKHVEIKGSRNSRCLVGTRVYRKTDFVDIILERTGVYTFKTEEKDHFYQTAVLVELYCCCPESVVPNIQTCRGEAIYLTNSYLQHVLNRKRLAEKTSTRQITVNSSGPVCKQHRDYQ